MNAPDQPLIFFRDDVLPDLARQAVNNFLHFDTDRCGWKFGWKSRGKDDQFSFWHRHFAGYRYSDEQDKAYDCSSEILRFPIIHNFWRDLSSGNGPLEGHRLIRCYANGHTYGSDGTVHTDTTLPNVYTCIYYPHPNWNSDWGGETIFFHHDRSDVLACAYPKPNRMVIFDGRIPHVARGISRSCPVLRVTLMFKTDTPNDIERDREIPA